MYMYMHMHTCIACIYVEKDYFVTDFFIVDMLNRCLLCGRSENSVNLEAYRDWVCISYQL